MQLLGTISPLFNHHFSTQLWVESGQAGRKVLCSLIYLGFFLACGSLPPLSGWGKWDIECPPRHCLAKPCSLWQTEDRLLLIQRGLSCRQGPAWRPWALFPCCHRQHDGEGSPCLSIGLHRTIRVKRGVKCVLFAARFHFCPTWSTPEHAIKIRLLLIPTLGALWNC